MLPVPGMPPNVGVPRIGPEDGRSRLMATPSVRSGPDPVGPLMASRKMFPSVRIDAAASVGLPMASTMAPENGPLDETTPMYRRPACEYSLPLIDHWPELSMAR